MNTRGVHTAPPGRLPPDGAQSHPEARSPSMGWILVNDQNVTELKSAERRLRETVGVSQALGPDVVANMETIIRGAKNIPGAPLAAYCRLEAEGSRYSSRAG